MIPRNFQFLILFLTAFFFHLNSNAQCDKVVDKTAAFLADDFISDGQVYRALIYDDQVAEFNVTLFGGAKYRIASLAGEDPGNLIFSLYDQENKLLFTNKDQNNSPYWDFKINSTVDCTIEAYLDPSKQTSGCAVLLIGFEK